MAAIATRRAGNNTFAPSDGSRTLIMHDAQPVTNPTGDPSAGDDDVGPGSSTTSNVGSIHLRGGPRVSRRRVAWTDETVDNEGMGKKKSKSESAIQLYASGNPQLTTCMRKK
jgi:protein phosphatase 1 regulatory subunit 11